MEKVHDGAAVVQEKAQDVKANAGARVRRELDTRSSEAGSQLRGTAKAMRSTTAQLRQDGNEGPAKAMELIAQGADRLGTYLTAADSNQLLRDVEAFARRRPWLTAAGGAAVGFFASRFLKASSSARYQRTTLTSSPHQAALLSSQRGSSDG